MRTWLIVLVSMIASATAAPIATPGRSSHRDKDAVSAETEIVADKDATNQPAKKQSEKTDGGTNDAKTSLLASILAEDNRAESSKRGDQSKDRGSKKNRKHKAIFVNYPVVQLPYDIDYNGNEFDVEERALSNGGYQESNIFYIRLPPTPYMFVPGLGYISQPPTYSTTPLRPQIPFVKPARPKPVHHRPVNPFIKLPIDFVSNGKPTSVYQWQKKPGKKPDTPITNLDSLSSEFVSNGKPTSIYQWQTNLKPDKFADDAINNLDNGPYVFNGKPTSFFLLKSDGTSSQHQPLRFSDYQLDNSYY